MRAIPLKAINDVKLFDDIMGAKRQPTKLRLKAARPAVLSAYKDYKKAAPEVGNLDAVHLTERQKDALHHAYNSSTIPLGELREKLISGRAVRCPFCSIGESDTLDHYLPKDLYPQFSIFSKNLVPCCMKCNGHKWQKVVDSNTDVRQFLHPYYDIIPAERFLTVKIKHRQSALLLKFQLVKPTGISNRVFIHLQWHFSLLELSSRYQKMSLDHLRDEYRALTRLYGEEKNATRVSHELGMKAGDFEANFGSNYWLATLYRALASDVRFCNGGFEVLK